MNLSKNQMLKVQQAVGYAVMYARTEHETAEFALLKIDIDEALIRQNALEMQQSIHDKMGCPFMYCDSKIKCVGKCRHANQGGSFRTTTGLCAGVALEFRPPEQMPGF